MADEPRKILVIMLRRIGDVLLTTPAVRALRKLFPVARIDFLVEPPAQQALEGDPAISTILLYGGRWRGLAWPLRLRRERYDWVIDYMGNPRTAALSLASGARLRAGPGHVAHRWAYTHLLNQSEKSCYSALEKIRVLRSLGLKPDESDFLPRWPRSEPAERFARQALDTLDVSESSLLVGLIPASRRVTRRWPASSYAALGRSLRDGLGARLLVFWGPGEKELAQTVCTGIGAGALLSPRTESLHQLAALLARCRIVVTNCNGPKHIAVARGVPTLTIHGASDPACWNPPDPRKHPVARLNKLHCIGCRRNSCPYSLECLRDLDPRKVYEQARELLQQAVAP